MRLLAKKIKTQVWSIAYIRLDDEEGSEVTEITPLFARAKLYNKNNDDDDKCHDNNMKEMKLGVESEFEYASNPWKIPAPREILQWPITLMLWCTIPDCRRFQKFYALTFINCIAWILILSYLISSMIAIVGK